MSESQIQFRTAALGGFQKQDVLNFVEQSAREHAEEVAALRRELEEAGAAAKEAKDRAAALAGQVETLERDNARLQEALRQKEEERSAAAGERDRLAGERDSLAAEEEALRRRIAQLAPLAEAYEGVKDRTAGMELEAHGRAQTIEREAKERAKKTQDQLKDWMDKMEESYGRLRAELEETLAGAQGELQKAQEGLKGITGSLALHDEALKALRRQTETMDGPKAPEPLPTPTEK